MSDSVFSLNGDCSYGVRAQKSLIFSLVAQLSGRIGEFTVITRSFSLSLLSVF